LFPAAPARQQRRRRSQLRLEVLEDRVTPNAYLVNVAGDTGSSAAGIASSDGNSLHGDLRYCLNKAIADQQADTITFASNVVGTISLNSALMTEPAGYINPFGQTAFIIGGNDNITIDGPGITLSGGGKERLFVVEGGGTLQMQNLTLSGGSARGGTGGNADSFAGAGGGGAGLGGAVFTAFVLALQESQSPTGAENQGGQTHERRVVG